MKTIEKILIPGQYQQDFEIKIKDSRATLTNFYILCKKSNLSKEEVYQFAVDFKKNFKGNCNIHVYDNEDITYLVDLYHSISEEDYIKKAEHFIATLFFTDDFLWYPFKDELYYSYLKSLEN
ncbi:hypothetical protein [Capnocytophaga sp.]|uniref:hypothetical protein n=1 Tax=Capnocytophaga sp. TaxID=44737 RepID=UPI0026DAEBEC|nr:hypothetical protein [Capnocytophaga sp.]MDO5106020.1 hypothetical protein [Capnocytophaga sp.]